MFKLTIKNGEHLYIQKMKNKIRFVIKNPKDNTQLSETDFIQKIEKSIQQSDLGMRKKLTKEQQKQLLGL